MSRFRTCINLPNFPISFLHRTPVLSIGSCFAEHMHLRLSQAKFSTFLNPFGISYNPLSIVKTLKYILDSRSYRLDQLVYDQGRWHSLDHHGHFSRTSPEATLERINDHLRASRHFLPEVKRLILTFGTSKVYVYKKTQAIVANCHKIPTGEFDRKDLSVSEITESLQGVLDRLKQKNPSLEVILTVSPVRHIRDGMVEQHRSKARLLVACAELSGKLAYVHYFPAYEIMMDELRDYRFYASDMIHPNEVAIEYIWEQFRASFFDEQTEQLYLRIQKIQKASGHRPFQAQSSEHQAFIEQQKNRMEQMEKEYPFLDFSPERTRLLKSAAS